MSPFEKAGVLRATIHDIRRDTTTVLVADQVDRKTIQEFMGHADIRTTLNLCVQSREKGRIRIAEEMERLLGFLGDPDEEFPDVARDEYTTLVRHFFLAIST